MTEADKKFHENDLPRILQAIKDCRESNTASTLVIEFSMNGGVLSILTNQKKNYK